MNTRDNVVEGAISALEIGNNLISSILGEHFEKKEMPENFIMPLVYESIGNKIWAASSIIYNAFAELSIAFNNYAPNEYYSEKIEFLSECLKIEDGNGQTLHLNQEAGR